MNFLSLIFRFQGDNSDFKRKCKESEHDVGGLSEKLERGLKGLGVGLGIGEVFKFIKEGVEQAHKLKDMEERLDIGGEAVQRYANAARRANTDIDAVAQSFDKMRKNIGTAVGTGSPAKEMAEHFEKLGISLEDLKSKDPQEIFDEVMAKTGSGALSTEQFTAATNALGKSFGKLIPFAKDLAKSHGDLLFTESELTQLQKTEHAFSTFFNNVKVAGGKAVNSLSDLWGTFFQTVMTGDVFGWRDANKQDDKDAAEERQAAAEEKRKRDEQDQIDQENKLQEEAMAKHGGKQIDETIKLEEEADKINEKNRFNALTDEQKINELLKDRVKLKESLAYREENFMDQELSLEQKKQRAEEEKKLAETNQEIMSLAHKDDKFQKPENDSHSRVGIFIGGKRDPLIGLNEQQLTELKGIKGVLDDIKTTPKADLFQ